MFATKFDIALHHLVLVTMGMEPVAAFGFDERLSYMTV